MAIIKTIHEKDNNRNWMYLSGIQKSFNTYSQIILDSLTNNKILPPLIEQIGNKLSQTERKENWKFYFCRIKAHAWHQGNDKLAKKAAARTEITESKRKISESVVSEIISDENIRQRQSYWEKSSKGQVTKSFLRKMGSTKFNK